MNSNLKLAAGELIKKSESPLIIILENTEGAAIAGALALFLSLKKLNKNPQIVCAGDIPEKFSYLPGINEITHDIAIGNMYKILIDVGSDGGKELVYEKVDNMLNIYLSTKADNISKESINVEFVKFTHDLVITVAVLNTEPIGNFYFKNKEFFFKTPMVSIGSPLPSQFKNATLTEIVSRSVSDHIADMTRELLASGWDKDIAMLLLSGIISETNNFQSQNIDHKIFSLTASLMSAGADRDEIIRHL